MPKINWQTVTVTAIATVAGCVLIYFGHEAWGGMLITFAVGGAAMKPAVNP